MCSPDPGEKPEGVGEVPGAGRQQGAAEQEIGILRTVGQALIQHGQGQLFQVCAQMRGQLALRKVGQADQPEGQVGLQADLDRKLAGRLFGARVGPQHEQSQKQQHHHQEGAEESHGFITPVHSRLAGLPL